MDRFLVVVHLHTERASGERMLRIAADFDRLPIDDLHKETTGIRAVIGTYGSSHFDRQGGTLLSRSL
jgi:hypothetical protein